MIYSNVAGSKAESEVHITPDKSTSEPALVTRSQSAAKTKSALVYTALAMALVATCKVCGL